MEDDFKRGLSGLGIPFFEGAYKCKFCGHAMDDRAVQYEDGEYTREIEFYCSNDKCPGPPKLIEINTILRDVEVILARPDLTKGEILNSVKALKEFLVKKLEK